MSQVCCQDREACSEDSVFVQSILSGSGRRMFAPGLATVVGRSAKRHLTGKCGSEICSLPVQFVQQATSVLVRWIGIESLFVVEDRHCPISFFRPRPADKFVCVR
jgi:hypothetical protein